MTIADGKSQAAQLGNALVLFGGVGFGKENSSVRTSLPLRIGLLRERWAPSPIILFGPWWLLPATRDRRLCDWVLGVSSRAVMVTRRRPEIQPFAPGRLLARPIRTRIVWRRGGGLSQSK
jgi:hypothetical protein